jgi:hypothetical protein
MELQSGTEFVPQPRVLTRPIGLCQDFSARDAHKASSEIKTAAPDECENYCGGAREFQPLITY